MAFVWGLRFTQDDGTLFGLSQVGLAFLGDSLNSIIFAQLLRSILITDGTLEEIMSNKKNVVIFSENHQEILNSLGSTVKIFCDFSLHDNKKDLTHVDLVIVDTVEGLSWVKRETRNLVLKPKCIFINSEELCRFDIINKEYEGLLTIHTKSQNYFGLEKNIRMILEPNLPTSRHKLLFVIPIFNEEQRIKNVSDFLTKIISIISKYQLDAKVRFVNDGSSDNSEDILKRIINMTQLKMNSILVDHFLDLKNLSANTRKAGIYSAGLEESDADYLFFLDSDNSFFEADIVKAISIIKDDYYDMIQATKDKTAENRSFIRRTMSLVKRLMTKSFLPEGVYDSQTGFKLIKTSAAKYVIPKVSHKLGFAADLHLLNLCKKARFRVLQLPVECVDQDGSHVDPIKDSINYLVSILKITFALGLNNEKK